MQYLKFCFHQGAGGRGYPRDHLIQLNQAGIPFGAKATDTMPFDAQEIARQFPAIKNTVIYRRSVPPVGDPSPSGNPDVPQYTLAPREAAVAHWAWHKRNFPPELDPAITWVETINEPAQHFIFTTLEEAQQVPLFGLRTITQRPTDGRWVVSNGEWLAQFAIHTADLAIADGYRWAAFGWSTGEPETAVWHGDRMVEFLRRCAGNPERLAVALHEYSQTTGSIFAGDTWLVGRFQHFYGACEDNGVPYPTTLITEWGWTLNDIPPWSVAEAHYLAAGELYARYPTIRTAATWALNAGWSGIADKAAAHIVPLQQLTLVTRFPDPQEPDPPNPPTPPGGTWEERAWALSVTEQIERGIPLNPDAGLQQAIFKAQDGRFTPVHRERTLEGKTFQAAEDVSGQKPRRVYVYEPGKVITYFLQPDGRPETIDAPIYWQRDPRWGSHLCGFGPKTIAEWGCLLCVYNALGEYWGLTDGREPNEENEWYKARGAFIGNKLVSMAMSQAYPRVVNNGWLPRGEAMHIMTQGYLAQGIPVPAWVDFRPSTPQWEQHWVLLVGYDAARDDYLMNDPWTGQTAVYVSDFYGIAGSDILECLYYTLDTAPPPGDLIDQTRYYSPPAGQTYGPITIKTTSWDGDVRQQLQKHGEELFVTKGHDIEVRRIDTAAGVIRFLLDDSPGDGKYYTVQSEDGWLPTAARVGDVFTRREATTFHWKADCDPTGERSTWTSQMKFAAFHARWVSPVNPAIVYENVAEWHWVLDGVVEEKYWLAPHRGYAGWWNRHGRSSYVREEIPIGQQGNNVFPGACYHPPVGVAWP